MPNINPRFLLSCGEINLRLGVARRVVLAVAWQGFRVMGGTEWDGKTDDGAKASGASESNRKSVGAPTLDSRGSESRIGFGGRR